MEGKVCMFENNVLFLDFMAEGRSGHCKCQLLILETLGKSGFPFHTAFFFPQPLAVFPWGEDICGDGSCFPAVAGPGLPEHDMIVSLGTVQRCQWRTEVSHALAIFFKAKKKRLLNLGTLDLKSSLPGVEVGTLYRVYQSAQWTRSPTRERFASHPSAKQ